MMNFNILLTINNNKLFDILNKISNSVIFIENTDQILELESKYNFLFINFETLQTNIISQILLLNNPNIIIFYIDILENINKIYNYSFIHDFIILPLSEKYILEKIKFWSYKEQNQNILDHYIFDRIEYHVNKVYELSNNNILNTNIKSIEWLLKYLEIDAILNIQLSFIDKIINFCHHIAECFNSKINLNIHNLNLLLFHQIHRKNLLKLIMIIMRLVVIEDESDIKVEFEDNLVIFSINTLIDIKSNSFINILISTQKFFKIEYTKIYTKFIYSC